MIINIDHIAYSSLDIESDIKIFEANKYNLQFAEILPNLKIKEQYLSKYRSTHELALLTGQKGYNVEILNHGEVTESDGYIDLIDNENAMIYTDDIDSSINFWSYFGFKKNHADSMIFSSLFLKDQKYVIKFKRCEKLIRKLNDKGFNCIAFVTTDIEKDCKNLSELGYNTTEIQNLAVNKKNMKIAFVQRDTNEIVELIEVKR